MKPVLIATTLSLGVFLSACSTEQNLKEKVTKILKEDPTIIQQVIEENPSEFVMSFQKAVKLAQADMAKKRKEEEQARLEESFKKPFTPMIRKDELIVGNAEAPLTLIEYTDFECPFCRRGKETISALQKKYGDKIKVVVKHLPLSFHPHAKIAAQYYEAIRLQDGKKAISFHDLLFESQKKLKNGETFLDTLVKKVGADLNKVKTDINSQVVLARIAEDQKEAQAFGFQGTPGFLINGIPVRGAYPADHFIEIVDKLKKRNLVDI